MSISHAKDIVDIKSFLSHQQQDAHPPLYFLLLKLWSYFGDGETYLRFLSVIFGILVIPATFFLGRQFFGRKTSLLAAFLVSISPFLLLFDREVRMYSLFVLLTISSILLYIKALRTDKIWYWTGYIFFTILNLYTHYHAFFVLASMWFFFFLRLKTYKSLWKKILISQIIIVLCFCFWLPTFLVHLNSASAPGGENTRFPTVFGFWAKSLYLFYSYSLGQTILPWNFPIVVLGAIIFSFLFFRGIKSFFGSPETLEFFLIFLFLPIVLALFLSDAIPRYLAFLSPIFCLIISEGISNIGNLRLQLISVSLIVVLLAFSLRNYYLNLEFHILASIDPWRETGEYLKNNVGKNDAVFNLGGDPINYYTGFNIPVLGPHSMQNIEEKLKEENFSNIWLIISNPQFKNQGEEVVKWMNERYQLISEKRFLHDRGYARKQELFNKNFLEYRIRIYQFKKR